VVEAHSGGDRPNHFLEIVRAGDGHRHDHETVEPLGRVADGFSRERSPKLKVLEVARIQARRYEIVP
jgi:hypothetical protein